MKLITLILLLLIANLTTAQKEFYSIDGGAVNGEMIRSHINDCATSSMGNYSPSFGPTFLDIAVTPDNTFYGVYEALFRLDLASQTFIPIGLIETYDGDYAAGKGLVGLNKDYVLGDDNDSLVKISVYTAKAERLGKIGYECGGDFAFFEGILYMADSQNHLIEIELDPNTYQVVSVRDVGYMTNGGGITYALFTTYLDCSSNEKGLFALKNNKVYQINTTNAQATLSCSIPNHVSWGGASIYGFDTEVEVFVPNIFTPNGDDFNDLFELNFPYKSLVIYNRWGNKVYESTNNRQSWNGKTTAGVDVPEGTYFYIIHRHNRCGEKELEKGTLTLMR